MFKDKNSKYTVIRISPSVRIIIIHKEVVLKFTNYSYVDILFLYLWYFLSILRYSLSMSGSCRSRQDESGC